MRWDCKKRGCFNVKRRPKIEMFAGALPGKISFGDIDGIVEINGYALLLEWKSERNDPSTGQRIMYERLTRNAPIMVLLMIGNAENMQISHCGKFYRGKFYGLQDATFDIVYNHIKAWAEWAKSRETPAAWR